jgi:hypothetical protein
MGVSSAKNLHTILKVFFVSYKNVDSTKVFNIDNMFNLLLSEYYRDETNTDINLKEKEVSLLLTIISQYVAHCTEQFKHVFKDKAICEKILESYNNHLLVNCKQLFFEKMTKYQDFA